ncbi:putative disease resistance protein RGA1 isoform X3 [Arachis duranensis]|uniref:Disease resistance protein RGA1 isoform X3 n=1 Tax=Arachis duranensis TaxID=130453 RepID=A0A9C6TE97_ARADU|nr:putative disease resistance protein RGA1 isoform X3 [Arachis duranensis]
MAESFIFSIAESLITKLASRAYQEASRVVGVYDDLQDLKTSLSYVKAVLLDAEQKQEQNHELREWLKQIKLIFYDAENLLDEVDCESLRKQLRITHKHKVGGFFSSSNPLLFRYKIAQRIKEIRKRLDRVAADRDKFGLQTIVVDKRIVYRREMTYSHVVESDVIGRDHDKGKIVKLLMEPSLDNNGGSKHISVIPIVGIGGLGKTTLAKLVFNDERITDTFSLKMWVCVSDEFDIKQLIIKIINAAIVSGTTSADALVYQQTLRDMDIEQLQYLLRNKLTGQKFLLVLDDVWSEDRAKWIQLRDLIKAGGAEGSKIVVTTRSRSVASIMGLLPPPSKNETSLDVANRYLSELMSRSFLENVSDVSTYYYFFIHDLVHDLAQYVASDDYQLISSENPNIPENVLHLSFTELDLFSQSFDINLSGVRTILFPFGIEKAGNEYLFTKWVSTCKYLRYLDLHDSTFETLPGSISKLKHLRFLSLIKNRRIRKLPASICTLQNLEELHLRGCVELETLPEKLRNLINLQRISITSKQSVLPEGDIAKLGSLKYLDIYACDNLESPFVEVKLSALRVLRIMRCKNLKSLPLDTHHFPQLEKFTLHACGNFELSDGDQDMNSVLRLKTIYFSMVMNFPYSLQGYSSTLQTLVFARCYELEALPEWLLNMTSLKYLHIWSCPRLISLPNGIHRFIALEVLRIHDCPELYRKYQPHVGEYWHQISHIKHTDIRKTWRSREEDFCDNQDMESIGTKLSKCFFIFLLP